MQVFLERSVPRIRYNPYKERKIIVPLIIKVQFNGCIQTPVIIGKAPYTDGGSVPRSDVILGH